MNLGDLEQRVLLLCPTGRDAKLAAGMLRDHDVSTRICDTLAALMDEIAQGAGCVLIAEEALNDAGIGELQSVLRDQPAWSDIPLLILARQGADLWTTARAMELLGNVTILERPARIAALMSAVRAALRARDRQYELRQQLLDREAATEAIAERDESLRMALTAGNMGAYDVDLRSGEATWTEASFAILGHPPTEDRHAAFTIYLGGIAPEDRDEVRRQQKHARETKTRYVLDHRFTRPDGKQIWLSTVGRYIYDESDAAFRTVGVFFDNTRRRELEDNLRQMNTNLAALVDERTRELRSLSHHLIEISENEKRALARELHDELGAMMTALLIDLDVIRRKADSPALRDVANRAAELVQSAAMVKRRIMEGLRPSVLDMMGLHEAVRSLAANFARRTGIECRLDGVEPLPQLDQRIAIALYRIVQEALTNVAKYAQATHVDIALCHAEDMLRLSVVDDGIGLVEATQRDVRSYGITGMRERVKYLGGEFTIEPTKGTRGTAVRVRIPMPSQAQEAPPELERRAASA